MLQIPNILTKIFSPDLFSKLINIGKNVWDFIKNRGIKDTEKIDEHSSPQDINQISIALSDIRAYTVQISNPIINKVKDENISILTEEIMSTFIYC